MQNEKLDGLMFKNCVISGALNLKANYEYVNSLNVFPVPDGDTGTNMRKTIETGAEAIKKKDTVSIYEVSKELSRGMLLGARGNSGVILSQIFRGIFEGLEGFSTVNAVELAYAFQNGVKQAYKAVKEPVEGTILTVIREATDYSSKMINDDSSIEEFFKYHLLEAKKSLARTKEMLPVLKEADVIDSGGAGYIYIIEGMAKALSGETIEENEDILITEEGNKSIDTSVFNADSELTYGYCTEFLLQLQNKKVDIATFDEHTIVAYLETIGDSIVALKDKDIIKVHVHTKDPGLVLTFARQFGEFLTLKIENMQVQHNEIEAKKETTKKHLKYALVAVANGKGLADCFMQLGANYIINGGQTMNPSADDFMKAFDEVNADNIFVLPNNSNIIMTANQAASLYQKAKVIVIPSKSLAAGYSAISMLDYSSEDLEIIEANFNDSICNVTSGSITYAIRDSKLNSIEIKKGSFIAIIDGELVASNMNKVCAFMDLLAKVSNLSDKEVLTVFTGNDVSANEVEEITNLVNQTYPHLEIYVIDGKQEVYSFILAIE